MSRRSCALPLLAMLAGCAHMPGVDAYIPQGAATSSASSSGPRVAVAPVMDLSPKPTKAGEDERLAEIRRAHRGVVSAGPKTHATYNLCTYRDSPIGPEKLTAVFLKELRAAGVFSSVEPEGAGPAELLVKPSITWCSWTVLGLNLHNVLDLEFEVRLERDGEALSSKSYKLRREKWRGKWDEMYTDFLPPLMREVREDIATAVP